MVLFRLPFLSNAKAYFPETSHHHLKYVWLSLCKIIFDLVKFYSCYCKIFRGITFFWTQCMYKSKCVCVCVSVCSLFLMHGHSFEWICTKLGMWHPYTLQMVMWY